MFSVGLAWTRARERLKAARLELAKSDVQKQARVQQTHASLRVRLAPTRALNCGGVYLSVRVCARGCAFVRVCVCVVCTAG